MNTDPADTRVPHLDLADLIAEAAGQALGDRAREHLARCEQCQLEARRWNLVADGVRGLADAAPEAAQPARPRRARQRVPAPWRRAMLVAGSAAAALVLFVGVGSVIGLVHLHLTSHSTSSPSTTETALTAVTGCPRLEQTDGTLEQVNGSSLVIKTVGGQPVTLTTTAATRLSASGALLADIKDGTPVLVLGPSSGGTISADLVLLGGNPRFTPPPGIVAAQGTVSDASAAGFAVVTPAGTRVPVTTSGGTDVYLFDASLGQLQTGGSIMAVGYPGPDGSLSAIGAVQPPSWPAGAHGTLSVKVKNCSPASINHEVMALASGS